MPLPGVTPWQNQDMVLYHGTLDVHVPSIMAGINLNRCKHLKDFGRGFYTTTNQQQAQRWANDIATPIGGTAAVIRFTVKRDVLAQLDWLVFVRPDTLAFDYWSFVEYCRKTASHHQRAFVDWFDVVAGPTTGSWKKQTVIPNSDQISFHTANAVAVLDNSARVTMP